MIINPHEAITKMTSEEYHDFMHGARQQQQAEEDHFTAAHAEREQKSVKEAIDDAKHQLTSRPTEPMSLGSLQILVEFAELALASEEAAEAAEYEYYENGQAQP